MPLFSMLRKRVVGANSIAAAAAAGAQAAGMASSAADPAATTTAAAALASGGYRSPGVAWMIEFHDEAPSRASVGALAQHLSPASASRAASSSKAVAQLPASPPHAINASSSRTSSALKPRAAGNGDRAAATQAAARSTKTAAAGRVYNAQDYTRAAAALKPTSRRGKQLTAAAPGRMPGGPVAAKVAQSASARPQSGGRGNLVQAVRWADAAAQTTMLSAPFRLPPLMLSRAAAAADLRGPEPVERVLHWVSTGGGSITAGPDAKAALLNEGGGGATSSGPCRASASYQAFRAKRLTCPAYRRERGARTGGPLSTTAQRVLSVRRAMAASG